jgi:hypothetical protein
LFHQKSTHPNAYERGEFDLLKKSYNFIPFFGKFIPFSNFYPKDSATWQHGLPAGGAAALS